MYCPRRYREKVEEEQQQIWEQGFGKLGTAATFLGSEVEKLASGINKRVHHAQVFQGTKVTPISIQPGSDPSP